MFCKSLSDPEHTQGSGLPLSTVTDKNTEHGLIYSPVMKSCSVCGIVRLSHILSSNLSAYYRKTSDHIIAISGVVYLHYLVFSIKSNRIGWFSDIMIKTERHFRSLYHLPYDF